VDETTRFRSSLSRHGLVFLRPHLYIYKTTFVLAIELLLWKKLVLTVDASRHHNDMSSNQIALLIRCDDVRSADTAKHTQWRPTRVCVAVEVLAEFIFAGLEGELLYS